MGIIFEPSEVYQLAVRIEENGEKFYRQMSEKFEDPELQKLFTLLADEELGHRHVYEKILDTLEAPSTRESYPGEYIAYLRAYADNIIFSQKEFDKKIGEISDARAAIDFAIGAELSSILYYQEIKKIVPENRYDKIEQIIDEERKHFVQLTNIKSEKFF